MNANNSIIAIRKKDIRLAHQAFADLMDKTENILNEEAFANPDEYKQLTSSSLESCAVEKIKLACADSPFDASEVELISGQRFPDIVAEKYYGIEVKSTKEDHWTSTGSSILETTRIENVDDIYMLFGKKEGMTEEKSNIGANSTIATKSVDSVHSYVDLALNNFTNLIEKY